VPATGDLPPEEISWRGESIRVVDFGRQDAEPWRDQRGDTGLIAIVLGQRDEACSYFGVAVRGGNLGVSSLADQEIEDLPEALLDYATAAFRMNGNIYQVPDLLALQRAIGRGECVAQ
jgi:chemotaxis signal transduction protein